MKRALNLMSSAFAMIELFLVITLTTLLASLVFPILGAQHDGAGCDAQ